jgi:methylase of polypeptide subunit release factors
MVRPWQSVMLGGIRVHFTQKLDGGGTSFGRQFIPFLQWCGAPAVERAFEWCAGPGFIGFNLLGNGFCRSLCLADINPEAVDACHRAISDNGLEEKVAAFMSDNLGNIPSQEKWDLVVSNPPHFDDVKEFLGDLRGHDDGWHIHRKFFSQVGQFLNPGGVIVLQENNFGSTAETFREMVEAEGLEIVVVHGGMPVRTVHHNFYFLVIMRKGDPPPDWVRKAAYYK